MDSAPSDTSGERPRLAQLTTGDRRSAPRGRWTYRLLVAALVVGGLLAARPAHRAIARWRSESLVKQADELLRQQAWGDAVSRLETAMRVDPGSIEVLRKLSGIYRRFELPAALPVLRALAAHSERTEDDVQQYLEVALQLQRFDLAETELSRLLSGTNASLRTAVVATEFFYRLGDFNRALGFANDARRREPTNHLHQLRVARVLLAMPDSARKTAGVELLQSLKNLAPAHRIDLYDMLSSAQGISRTQVAAVLDSVPEPTDPSPLEYFLRATLRVRLDPDERGRLIEAAIRKHRNGTPEFQSDLAAWLIRNDAAKDLLEIYKPADAAKTPGLFSHYLDALASLNRWQDLPPVLAGTTPLDPWTLESWRALAALKLKQPQLAEEHWRRAFDAAGVNPSGIRMIGELAFRHGSDDTAVKAFTLLSENRLHRGVAFRRLAAVHERRRDTPALRTVMQSWAATSDHPLPEQAFCYFSALLGKDLDLALPRARKLLERMPNRVPYRATVAFLELRRGNTKEAASLFGRASLDPGSVTPQTRLVEAMVLEATGDAKKAAEIASAIPTDSLYPEEQEIARRLKRGDAKE